MNRIFFYFILLLVSGCHSTRNSIQDINQIFFTSECQHTADYRAILHGDTLSIEDYSVAYLSEKFAGIDSFLNWSISYGRASQEKGSLILSMKMSYEDATDSIRTTVIIREGTNHISNLEIFDINTPPYSSFWREKLKRMACQFIELEVQSIRKINSHSFRIKINENSPIIIYSQEPEFPMHTTQIADNWYILSRMKPK